MAPVNHETLTLSPGAQREPAWAIPPREESGPASWGSWSESVGAIGSWWRESKIPLPLVRDGRIGQKVGGGKGNCVSKKQQPLIRACPFVEECCFLFGESWVSFVDPILKKFLSEKGSPVLFVAPPAPPGFCWVAQPLSLSLKNCIHFFILLFHNYQHIFICVGVSI